jgi:transcriptional regulator of aromatic amino acid metabolism
MSFDLIMKYIGKQEINCGNHLMVKWPAILPMFTPQNTMTNDLPAENAIIEAIRLLSDINVPLNEITVPMEATALLQDDDHDNALERIQSQFNRMLLRGGFNQV